MARLVVCFLIVLMTACSSSKVINTEKADNVDFSTYKTFDFYQVEARGDTISQKFNERVAKLQDAIAIKMQQLGYLLSKTNPDLLINTGIVVKEEVQTRQTDFRTDAPRYIGQRRYSWKSEEVETGRYREGTVTVHVIDAKQNKMIWKGAIEDIIPKKESRVEATITKGVNKLFDDYPTAANK
ncbi:MAG: DUF4136 domain-containing protein [Williamsia sp.]|nr:DUF4136 domain-containing protein [Williamsia sp.]